MTLNNFIFGSNQIVYTQFSNFVAICMFWHNFWCFCVWWNLWSHFNIYQQLIKSGCEIQHFPIQTQTEGPLILKPNIFQIFWRIGSRFLSNLHIFRLSDLFLWPSLIWFSNLSFSISQLNHIVGNLVCLLFHKSDQNKCLPKNIAGAVGHWNTKLNAFLSVSAKLPQLCLNFTSRLLFERLGKTIEMLWNALNWICLKCTFSF